jgi:transcriptional regulator with XRE-family HTH domain
MGEETALRRIRRASGMSIRQIAAKLGIKEDRYRKWETGTTSMNVVQAAEVADILDCSIDELVGHETDQLSTNEHKLVRLYRSANEQGKSAIMAIAENQAGDVARRAAPPGLESTA